MTGKEMNEAGYTPTYEQLLSSIMGRGTTWSREEAERGMAAHDAAVRADQIAKGEGTSAELKEYAARTAEHGNRVIEQRDALAERLAVCADQSRMTLDSALDIYREASGGLYAGATDSWPTYAGHRRAIAALLARVVADVQR